jgi:flagellar hook-basal body complex protein FliE
MSDPIGAAAGRLSAAPNAVSGQGRGDTGVRQVPLFPEGADGASFGDSLTRALNDVSAQQDHAADTLGAFLRGENVELHQVMAATEEAQISLQMLIEVRNKFTEAYRTLSNMQG